MPKKKLPVIRVVNKSPNELPSYAYPTDSGMDVRAWCTGPDFIGDCAQWDEVSQCVRIFSGGRAQIHTGLYFNLPEGFEIQVRPRSGLALKQGVTVANSPGTVDAGFNGQVCVILVNLSQEAIEVRTGDKIAQLVVAPTTHLPLEQVESLEQTDRGANGFGSTGIQ